MLNLTKFGELYQHLKNSDQKLHSTLDKVSSNFDVISKALPTNINIGGVNYQTSNYTARAKDSGKLLVFNGSSLSLWLPSPPIINWFVQILNLGSTILTINRNGLLINRGTSNITINPSGSVFIYSDGSNYYSYGFTGTDTQIAYGNSTLSLSTSHADVPGCTLTLAKIGTYLITGTFSVFGSGAGDVGNNVVGLLSLDGVEQTAGGFFTVVTSNCVASVSQQWIYSCPAIGKIAKLRAFKTGGTGGSTILSSGNFISSISAICPD